MPGCVLRVGSKTKDVELLLRTSGLKPVAVFRKGEPRAPGIKRLNRQSGFNVDVSLGDGVLDRQVRDAMRFLIRNAAGLSRMRGHPKCGTMTLDFGVDDRDTRRKPWRSYRFPAILLELAAKHGMEIELSFYGRS